MWNEWSCNWWGDNRSCSGRSCWKLSLSRSITHDCKHGTDSDCLVLFDQNLLNDTSHWTWNLGVNLVCRDFNQRLVNAYAVANLFEPSGDSALGY
jgi:hypothetical protein